MLGRRGRNASRGGRGNGRLRLFYCGDIHGSDVCFRKFINAGSHYEADVLILGGDITGKALVPIVRVGEHGWRCYLHGQERIGEGEEDLAAVRMAITHAGFYPIEMSGDDLAALERDEGGQQAAFRQAMIEQVRAWTALAAERLKGTGRVCLVMPGNDDEYYIDDYLGDGDVMRNVDGQVVQLSNGVEVLSLAWSNATPWNSAREFSEEKIAARLDELSRQLKRPDAAIFNTHVPPSATGIDTVQKLDADLRPIIEHGMVVEIPAGSTAVREVIMERQPRLGLHGHIHESKGEARLGRTLCINPGSDYASGRLHGVLIDITPERVERHIFTQG